MNIIALVISLFSALISFFQGGCGILVGGLGMTLSQRVGDRATGQEAALFGGGGLLIALAAITAIVGGLFAYSRKKNARIVLAVSAVLCVLAGLMGLKDGFVWGTLYAIATGCAHIDIQKSNRPKKAEWKAASPVSWLAREKKAIDESTPPVVASMVRETPIETAALVKKAFLFLEDGNFGEADRHFEQALNQDPENAKAYIGKLLVELNIKKEDDLVQYSSFLDSFSFYQKALRFASEDYKSVLIGYTILDRLEKIESVVKRML